MYHTLNVSCLCRLRDAAQLITSSFITDRKSELQDFSIGPNDFSRDRKLDVVNTVGMVCHMAVNGNDCGYAITAQIFFSEMGQGDRAPNEQAVSRIAEQMVEEAGRILWRKQPGRSFPRVSKQPICSWNPCKIRKLEAADRLRRRRAA